MNEPTSTIDLADPDASARWAERLNVTRDQLAEAIDVVGDRASDVELHLKGTRATTTADLAGRAGDASTDAR